MSDIKKIKDEYLVKINNNHNLESISLGINKITKLFIRHKPKLVCVVGDRYEMLYCALSSYFLNIPIAHLISMGSESFVISNLISHVYSKYPYNFDFH